MSRGKEVREIQSWENVFMRRLTSVASQIRTVLCMSVICNPRRSYGEGGVIWGPSRALSLSQG